MTATITAPAATTTWQIDPSHSSLEFSVKHLMIATVKGRFTGVDGSVVVDEENPTAATVDVTIDAASITTSNDQRDAHLRSADFFDVENHSSLRFVGRRIEGSTTGEFALVGDLTIRGVTREVTLATAFEGRGGDPWGGERAAFSASTKIRRSDWGLTWNMALEAGGLTVSDDVKLQLDVELVRK